MLSLSSGPGRASLAIISIAATLSCPSFAGAVPALECASGALPVSAASVPDPRSVGLKDNSVLRVAGIESFSVLGADPAAADAALLRRINELAGDSGLQMKPVAEARDRYGRIPALLILPDGRLLQEILVSEGVAVALGGGAAMPCFDRILAGEDTARRAERGFWAGISIPQARPESLVARTGRFTIFEGRVTSVGIRRSATYLNFGERWSEDVTVEVRGRNRDLFLGKADLSKMTGRRIRVRGFLEDRSGPAMTVSSPMQIELLDSVPGDAGSDGGRP